jgi:hypothetical protein
MTDSSQRNQQVREVDATSRTKGIAELLSVIQTAELLA